MLEKTDSSDFGLDSCEKKTAGAMGAAVGINSDGDDGALSCFAGDAVDAEGASASGGKDRCDCHDEELQLLRGS